ncbi:hypothetical protein F5Y12DRAFT_718315 [Xylaria sp. FL1777]|nr:hypothetical protein F5Y12DRAFT_718315 [Xylaria sp. FL1777]
MALGNDDNPNNGPSQPFAYVLIPVLGFGLIVSLITCYRYRRRKQRLARLSEEGGGPTFVRDPETGRARVDRRGAEGAVATGRRRAGRRLGLGVGSREEGLNELGEAPPAYTPNAPKPPSVENVELMTYSQATAEAGTSRSPPTYGEQPSSGARAGPGMGTAGGSSSGGGGGGASGTARLSEEMRRDATGNTTASGAGETARLSEEMRGPTGNATTTSGASDTVRPSEEVRRDATGDAPTATIEAAADTPTAASSSTNEPAPPPRAVLPPAST